MASGGDRPVIWNPVKGLAPNPPMPNSENPSTNTNQEYHPNFIDNRNWVHTTRNLHNSSAMDQNTGINDSSEQTRNINNSGPNLHVSQRQNNDSSNQSDSTANQSVSSALRHGTSSVNTGTDPIGHTDTSQSVNNEVTAPGQSIHTQDLNAGVITNRPEMRHEALPDLLHSHVIPTQAPPPPMWQGHSHPSIHNVDPRGYNHPPRHSRHHQRRHHRSGHRSHHGRSRRRSRSTSVGDEEPCRDGCMKCLAATTSFRWILVILSLLGVCCVVTGIVLAALHAAGNSFLFLAIMFIGLGVLLVVVVAVGWKCTPRGHEPLHALFGLGEFRHHSERRSRPRHHGRSSRGREPQWYGGMMYPEFQYRRPPPSYNASMQDFQHQLILAQTQREHFHSTEELPAEDYSLPSSPPPSYRSRASTVRTGIQITFPPVQGDSSRPPTYRSHASTVGQGSHSRPSLPEDYIQQGGDVAFIGPQSNSPNHLSQQQHSRNSSAGNFRIHSRDNSASGAVVVSSAIQPNSSQDQLLDSDVQQTLQTLDDVNGQDNPARDISDDEYPIETPL